MKIRINFYTGTSFLFEWEPMEDGRFYALVGLIAAAMLFGFFYGITR